MVIIIYFITYLHSYVLSYKSTIAYYLCNFIRQNDYHRKQNELGYASCLFIFPLLPQKSKWDTHTYSLPQSIIFNPNQHRYDRCCNNARRRNKIYVIHHESYPSLIQVCKMEVCYISIINNTHSLPHICSCHHCLLFLF